MENLRAIPVTPYGFIIWEVGTGYPRWTLNSGDTFTATVGDGSLQLASAAKVTMLFP